MSLVVSVHAPNRQYRRHDVTSFILHSATGQPTTPSAYDTLQLT